jgi:hypothetical protein
MEMVRTLLASALLLLFTSQAQAALGASPDAAVKVPQERGMQPPSEPALKATPDPGAIVVPPKVDPEAIETPPKNIDPGINKPPPATGKEKSKKSRHQRKSRQHRAKPATAVPPALAPR